jgi:hypothetical protein
MSYLRFNQVVAIYPLEMPLGAYTATSIEIALPTQR